jgi:hypothetical protein
VAALPFVLVMVGLAVALVKDLSNDPMVVRREYAREAVDAAVVTGVTEHGDDFVLQVDRDPAADDKHTGDSDPDPGSGDPNADPNRADPNRADPNRAGAKRTD